MLYGLDDGDLPVLRVLADMPLANAADVAWGLQEEAERRVRERLDRLRNEGMADSARISFLGSRGERYWLTEQAQVLLEIQGVSWNQPGCLMRQLERLSAVEWLYPAAAQITGMGRFQSFQWVDGRSFDAAVRYEEGWAALFWVGLLRSEKGIGDRLRGLGRDLEELASGHPQPRPGLLCFVVIDLWEGELVRRAAGRLGMEEWVAIMCVQDGSWHGAADPTPSWGWVRQPVYRRTDSWAAWQKRVRESWFSEEGNSDPRELLRRVRPALREAMGDRHAADRWVNRARRELRGLEGPGDCIPWLRRAQTGLNADGLTGAADIVAGWPDSWRIRARRRIPPGCCWASPSGRECPPRSPRWCWARVRRAAAPSGPCCGCWTGGWCGAGGTTGRCDTRSPGKPSRSWAVIDRTNADAAWSTLRMEDWTSGQVSEPHQYGVMDVAAQFLGAGCPVAAGWRDNEPLGFSGGIVPDWMVRLTTTPFLPGWHYGEYDRSARDTDAVTRKMNGFNSPFRVNTWPLLVISAGDDAEDVFHAVGGGMGLRTLTTTIDRTRTPGVAGAAGCWRLPEYLGGSLFLDPGEQPVLG